MNDHGEGLDWELRSYQPSDQASVRRLLTAGFETIAEADLAEKLRAEAYSEIELVAASQGEIVGYVILSRMAKPGGALGLGPVATKAGLEGMGVASSLIESALALAAAADWQLVFLLGEPRFYERFGFSAEDAARFESAYNSPYWQVALLSEDAPAAGEADYAPPFSELS